MLNTGWGIWVNMGLDRKGSVLCRLWTVAVLWCTGLNPNFKMFVFTKLTLSLSSFWFGSSTRKIVLFVHKTKVKFFWYVNKTIWLNVCYPKNECGNVQYVSSGFFFVCFFWGKRKQTHSLLSPFLVCLIFESTRCIMNFRSFIRFFTCGAMLMTSDQRDAGESWHSSVLPLAHVIVLK